MRRRRRFPIWLVLIALAVLAAAGAFALARQDGGEQLPPRHPAEQPTLMLVTSLPLIFPESFSLESSGSPALEALESRYRVEPVGVADARSLEGSELLLMAQPLAQPAEVLVELDRWVRQGGRVLILADPRLERRSELPLGDVRRPAPFYADTGLLGHWGLRLDAPDEAGPQDRQVDGRQVRVVSPGTLVGDCATAGEGLVARCRIGEGKATIIADADLIDPAGAAGSRVDANLQLLLAELARLER